MDRKAHWETVFSTKKPEEVSWTQSVPEISLRLIESLGLPMTASVIDVGGGDSKLVDHLLHAGYTDVTVLDISAHAIDRAKARLGKDGEKVNWIVSDVNDFSPERPYDIWHDRAAFHFLTEKTEIERYVRIASRAARYLVLGTFSTSGPVKCSGLEVSRYDEDTLPAVFSGSFEKIECVRDVHVTPFGTTQEFLFCTLRRIP